MAEKFDMILYKKVLKLAKKGKRIKTKIKSAVDYEKDNFIYNKKLDKTKQL